jgi:hypothetical protein
MCPGSISQDNIINIMLIPKQNRILFFIVSCSNLGKIKQVFENKETIISAMSKNIVLADFSVFLRGGLIMKISLKHLLSSV